MPTIRIRPRLLRRDPNHAYAAERPSTAIFSRDLDGDRRARGDEPWPLSARVGPFDGGSRTLGAREYTRAGSLSTPAEENPTEIRPWQRAPFKSYNPRCDFFAGPCDYRGLRLAVVANRSGSAESQSAYCYSEISVARAGAIAQTRDSWPGFVVLSDGPSNSDKYRILSSIRSVFLILSVRF